MASRVERGAPAAAPQDPAQPRRRSYADPRRWVAEDPQSQADRAAGLTAAARRRWGRRVTATVLLAVAVVVMALVALTVGTIQMSPIDILRWAAGQADALDPTGAYVVGSIRAPRVLMALVTGVALGMSGVVLQNLLRNPLAEPYTLGISSGASFGAAIGIVFGSRIWGPEFIAQGQALISISAFVCGSVAMATVLLIGRWAGGSVTILLLAGVAVGSLFSAGLASLKYISNEAALRDLMLWLMGGFWGASWRSVAILGPVVLVATVFIYRYATALNAVALGDDLARTMGVDVKRTTRVCVVLCTLIASVCIAFSGIIGFVGLVAPHITRMLVGLDNRVLIPAAAFSGALLLLVADTLARNVFSPLEIPVGIITSLIGAPFFIHLLLSSRSAGWRS
ncbi:FecCD family ABC transporter permease [Gephyromycinifex aptenodytis]|uniref:FecCD family ABC transporter permease n=1 Tax=Gephyromycinifex aptenodytis TaxID=2716227 RepID=UPI001B2FF530|nr:iron ABC transporter permease [Gephyromycinifex aptenodytis]